MALHLIRIITIILLLLACIFLPFLPGEYDGLAVTLSAMAQLFSVVGLLLLVPIGALWLLTSKKTGAYPFAVAAVVATSLIAAAMALSAAVTTGLSLGIITLALWVYLVVRLMPGLKRLKTTARAGVNPVPLYLVCIPVVLVILQFTLVPRAVVFSRQRAIQQSAPLINAIEAYRQARGNYPSSLAALWPDFKTGVRGMSQYHYEPKGETYNLFFEQFTYQLGAREIVMYNQLDEHHFTSHVAHILEWTPEQLRSRKTYVALQDTASLHWKYFWFD